MDMNPILKKIQSYMKVKNWSIYKLAKESDVPYSSLNSMFLKNTQPTIPTLEKICCGLGISMSDFFENGNKDNLSFIHIEEDEKELLYLYNNLSTGDKERFLYYAMGFAKKSPDSKDK